MDNYDMTLKLNIELNQCQDWQNNPYYFQTIFRFFHKKVQERTQNKKGAALYKLTKNSI